MLLSWQFAQFQWLITLFKNLDGIVHPLVHMCEVPFLFDKLPDICLLKRFLVEFNCLMRIPVYIHSANIPISLHFLSRHSWHFLRMYISITQLPPFLHLYTAFLVMLLLKKPVEEMAKSNKAPNIICSEKLIRIEMPKHFLMNPWRAPRQSLRVLLAKVLSTAICHPESCCFI